MSLNAARIVDAISRIGYKPAAALMDILDNSVMADAKNVTIELVIDEDFPLTKKSNVVKYRIIDDGKGMSIDEVENALTPGSIANYSDKSLSKYGMGLKSAGFSMGDRICVLSKKIGTNNTVAAYVDRNLIHSEDGYYVYQPENIEDIFDLNYFDESASGTCVEIQDVRSPHEAALTTINKLKESLGVTYYGYLDCQDNPLNISIKYRDNVVEVLPHDILFKNSSKSKYVKDEYDYESVYLTQDDFPIEVEDAPGSDPIKINVAMFPRDIMKNYGGFSQEQKNKVASYKVGSKNSGFFVYRNGRLIRWGDRLPDGKGGTLISRDELNLRATIEFETQHDDALHVDVSKQRFELPAQVSDALKEILLFPKEQAKDIMSMCTDKYNSYEAPVEGGSFNENNSELFESDSKEAFDPVEKEDEKERRKRLRDETESLEKQIENNESDDTEIDDSERLIPQKIRYSDKVVSNNLWEVGLDSETGVYVVVNKNHPYYKFIINNLGESTPERQSLEAILWSLSAAESIVRTRMNTVDDEILKEVMGRFKSEVGYNINHWVAANVKLFD